MAGDIGNVDAWTATRPIVAHRIIHVGVNGDYDHGEWYVADLAATVAIARAAYPTMIHAIETRYVTSAAVTDMQRGQPPPYTTGIRSPASGWTAALASTACASETCRPGIVRTSP